MQEKNADSKDQTRAVVVYSNADERSTAEERVLATHPGGKYSQSSDNRKNFFSHISGIRQRGACFVT
jgi:hypothetical protein